MRDIETITVGSGFVHMMPVPEEIPEDITTLATDENIAGYIEGGGTLAYKPSKTTFKDDMGKVSKTILTDEEASFKTGIMTWTIDLLNKLIDTARVEKTTKHKILKIGGIANAKDTKQMIIFHHVDAVDGDLWIVIVGSNESEISLGFLKDKNTTVDTEFKAVPLDSDGTLIMIIEELPKTEEVQASQNEEETPAG